MWEINIITYKYGNAIYHVFEIVFKHFTLIYDIILYYKFGGFMATRSTIWIKNGEDNYTGIYCHWDGYLDNNGAKLLNHYKTEEAVRSLIALGSLSSLDNSIECPEGHSFDTPVDGYCVAYHRDRGEDIAIRTVISQTETKQEEYSYLFKDGAWFYSDHGGSYKQLTYAAILPEDDE